MEPQLPISEQHNLKGAIIRKIKNNNNDPNTKKLIKKIEHVEEADRYVRYVFDPKQVNIEDIDQSEGAKKELCICLKKSKTNEEYHRAEDDEDLLEGNVLEVVEDSLKTDFRKKENAIKNWVKIGFKIQMI